VACRPVSTSSGDYSAGSNPSARQGKPKVFVVNYPLEYFARRIGGELVDVEFPVPPEVDPAFWKPDDATVAQFQQADLIFLNGAGYARWTQQVSLPDSRLVDTAKSFADKLIRFDDGVVHSHGPGGDHSHQGFAFTTWLDPQLAMLQAQRVHESLVELLPASEQTLDTNFRQLQAKLELLDQQLEEVATHYQDEPLLASHPVYQYLARRCGWNMKSVHWEPDEVPEAKEWESISQLLESHPSKWMLWEAAPRPETAERLAAIGVTCIVFEPCGNQPAEDYFQVMTDNIQRLMTIFPG
ncbi:MAG: metal ABC transporter substrate-binding protein, partial [Pirellulaceae bacterium]|nr:metal ABC transporter substrate-binding protein [Pirellulaceae bacterium]